MTWKHTLHSWFHSRYGLLGAFLVLTLGPATGLVWLGWRLLDQDRALETQRIAERREYAADRIVAMLQGCMQKAEDDLNQLQSPLPGEDALIAEFKPSGIRAYPDGSLLFYPADSPLQEIPSDAFREVEILEFQRNDYTGAVSVLEPMTRSHDRSIRAGAWFRIARNQRKCGQLEQALRSYSELAQYSGTVVANLPADLVARRSRCTILAQLNHPGDLAKEAGELYARLQSGYWQLTQPVYEVIAEEAAGWSGLDRCAENSAAALAEAVAWVKSKEEQTRGESGLSCITRRERLVTVLWIRQSGSLRILAAGPAYLERQWLSPLAPLAENLRVEFSVKEMHPESVSETERSPTATGLPWTILVDNRDLKAEMNEFEGRRSLLLGVFTLLAIVIAAGSYTVARAIGREFAVMRLQSEFVSAVSHELRTPLTSLRQLSEVLNEDRPLEEDRRRNYYRVLDRATLRLQKLVAGLLDFGRMEAGAMVYRKCDLDAGAFLVSIVGDFQREAADQGHRIEVKTEQNLPGIHGDPDALGNAVWNLLDNAVKYSPEHKTIRIEVECDGSHLAIRVRDQGLGIPEAERGRILRKFVRGTAAETMGIKGTGIGLAMVKHIVDAHGGTLRVESVPGEGSTFTILLPVGR
jgi:signal transduction histidine kinase